jgi:hypothetical protein
MPSKKTNACFTVTAYPAISPIAHQLSAFGRSAALGAIELTDIDTAADRGEGGAPDNDDRNRKTGEEITAAQGPLSAGLCAKCHTDASGVNGGQCGTIE